MSAWVIVVSLLALELVHGFRTRSAKQKSSIAWTQHCDWWGDECYQASGPVKLGLQFACGLFKGVTQEVQDGPCPAEFSCKTPKSDLTTSHYVKPEIDGICLRKNWLHDIIGEEMCCFDKFFESSENMGIDGVWEKVGNDGRAQKMIFGNRHTWGGNLTERTATTLTISHGISDYHFPSQRRVYIATLQEDGKKLHWSRPQDVGVDGAWTKTLYRDDGTVRHETHSTISGKKLFYNNHPWMEMDLMEKTATGLKYANDDGTFSTATLQGDELQWSGNTVIISPNNNAVPVVSDGDVWTRRVDWSNAEWMRKEAGDCVCHCDEHSKEACAKRGIPIEPKPASLHQAAAEEVEALVSGAIEGKTLTQLLTTATGILTSMYSSFSESPPDYEYAFDSLNTQGWKIVKLLVPKEKQAERNFRNANRAWREAFSDAGYLVEDLVNGAKGGEVAIILDSVHATVSKALRTCSKAFPDSSKEFNAFEQLVDGVTGSGTDFAKAMGWLDVSSLIQEGAAQEKPNFTQLLTPGVGILTALISAFTEDPPDYEFAIDSVNVQGWKMVKLFVPKEEHRSDKMRNGKRAWDRVMWDANDILEDALEAKRSGYMGKVIEVLLTAIDTALSAAAEVLSAQKALLQALAELIKGLGGSILEFSVEMAWIAEN